MRRYYQIDLRRIEANGSLEPESTSVLRHTQARIFVLGAWLGCVNICQSLFENVWSWEDFGTKYSSEIDRMEIVVLEGVQD